MGQVMMGHVIENKSMMTVFPCFLFSIKFRIQHQHFLVQPDYSGTLSDQYSQYIGTPSD